MTNNLDTRLKEHESSEGNRKRFTGRYNCHYLLYYEGFNFVYDAISREKELKKWNRTKKERLIGTLNPAWTFLNDAQSFDHKGKTGADTQLFLSS
jgi:putative endonuclease